MARDDRRWGKWRNWWVMVAVDGDRGITDGATPWTFRQVCDACWGERMERFRECRALGMGRFDRPLASRIRSIRRALAGMVDDGHIIALGKPSDPKRRYVAHPFWFKEDDPRRSKVIELLTEQLRAGKLGDLEALRYEILDHELGFSQQMMAKLSQTVDELKNKSSQ